MVNKNCLDGQTGTSYAGYYVDIDAIIDYVFKGNEESVVRVIEEVYGKPTSELNSSVAYYMPEETTTSTEPFFLSSDNGMIQKNLTETIYEYNEHEVERRYSLVTSLLDRFLNCNEENSIVANTLIRMGFVKRDDNKN